MRRIHVLVLFVLSACGWIFAAGAPLKAHPTYRIGKAPKTEFKIGTKSYKIEPHVKSVQTIRALPPEHFDPTTRHERVEKFYREKVKTPYEEWHKRPGQHCGPYRWEYVYWIHHHWPARVRAIWAWHHRIYIDEILWLEWMNDRAFAAQIAAMKRDNVVPDLDYVPQEYASVAPAVMYNDEYLNAVFNPMPFLAVLTLRSIKPDAKTSWIGAAATDSLVSKLASVPGLFVAEREQLAGALKEQKLQDGDASEPGRAAKIGKALNVARVVAGSYVVDGDKVLFNLRIVDVETGAVKNGISKAVPRDKLLDEMPGLALSLATELGFDAPTDLLVSPDAPPAAPPSGGGSIFTDIGPTPGTPTPSKPTPPTPVPSTPAPSATVSLLPPVSPVPAPSGPARRVFAAADKITGDLSFTAAEGPYEIREKLEPPDDSQDYTLRIGPGAEIRGGTIVLVKGGHIEITGTANNPAVLRHVTIQQTLHGSFKARYAILEDCKFRKGGSRYSYSGNSSKWEMDKCLITGDAAFPKLTHIDYGIKLTDCTFSGVVFENIVIPTPNDKYVPAPKDKPLDYMESFRKGWRTIDHCRFDHCTVPPTVFWCATSSNYTHCAFAGGPAFESDTATDVVAYLAGTTGDGPDAIARATPAKRAALRITATPQPFQVFAFPK